MGHLVVARGGGERRQLGRDQAQVERARQAQFGGALDDAGIAAEALVLLGPGAQVAGGRRDQPAVHLVQAAAGPDRGQAVGERAPGLGRVVDVVGGDHADARPDRQFGQGVVAGRVEGVGVVPQLDVHVVRAEPGDQVGQLPGRLRGAALGEGERDRALATAGQHCPMTVVQLGQPRQLIDGLALLLAVEVGLADGAAQPAVALGVAGEDQEVGALGVGEAVLGLGQAEGQLSAEDGGQADRGGGLGEADDAVHAVVVGDGEGVEAQPDRLLHQLLGVRRAVQEAEVGVAVQLGIGDGAVAAGTGPGSRRGLRWLGVGLGRLPRVGRLGLGLGVPRPLG